jgi:hypothetical protein
MKIMSSTIVKAKDGYGMDVWGNYLTIKMSKDKKGVWVYSNILIIRDDEEKAKAKVILDDC